MPETDKSFRRTDYGAQWLRIEESIRDSGVKVCCLADSRLSPVAIGTVTFDGPIATDALVSIELLYGDLGDSRSPHVSVATIWTPSSRPILNTDRVDVDHDYFEIEVDYAGVGWAIEAKGGDKEWSGCLQIDDFVAGIRVSVAASRWTEHRVQLALVEDIEQLLQQRRELISRR